MKKVSIPLSDRAGGPQFITTPAQRPRHGATPDGEIVTDDAQPLSSGE